MVFFFFFWVINDRCGVWVIGVGLWVCRGLRGFGLARVIGVGLWISVSGFFLGDWCGVWVIGIGLWCLGV